jgi:hypothetical protein
MDIKNFENPTQTITHGIATPAGDDLQSLPRRWTCQKSTLKQATKTDCQTLSQKKRQCGV